MKMLIPKHCLGILASIGLVATAQAGLITPGGNLESGNDSASAISALLGYDVVLLYKAEYDDGDFDDEEGSFAPDGGPAGPNFTIIGPYGSDFNLADISWNLTGTGFELRAVAWKSATSYWWSGIEDDQFLVGGPHTIATSGRAVSHISFYGVAGGETVPDGGTTLILLGSVLAGFGMVRRLYL